MEDAKPAVPPIKETKWIQVYTGRKFYPLAPRAEDVDIEDIAHALSLMCRYAGHIKRFYSVAQHCIEVSNLCDPADALWGLLHDASEAYLVDIPRPIKRAKGFKFYRVAEKQLQAVICERYGLAPKEPTSVKIADRTALAIECDNLSAHPLVDDWAAAIERPERKLICLPPAEAEQAYLQRFYELTKDFS